MKLPLRLFSCVLSCGLALAAPAIAAAAGWPDKPVRIVVTFPPGGTTDIMAREIAAGLQPRWQVPVTVENRAGAGGSVGAAEVARSRADGYTLLFGTSGTQAINPVLYRSIPYDAQRDFAPITRLGSVPNILLVHPSTPAATAGEFVRLVKAHPGRHAYASSGQGTPQHLNAELLVRSQGLEMIHVPYGGAAPGVAALLGGHVTAMFPSLPSAGIAEHVRSGRLRALAVTGEQRATALPEVPTVKEAGLPELQMVTWYGLLAPAGTPGPVLDEINAAVRAVLADPAAKRRLEAAGIDVETGSRDDFAAFIARESTRWQTLIRNANIHLD